MKVMRVPSIYSIQSFNIVQITYEKDFIMNFRTTQNVKLTCDSFSQVIMSSDINFYLTYISLVFKTLQ